MTQQFDSRPESWIPGRLDELRGQGLERRLSICEEAGGVISIEGRRLLNFASNDYLALAHRPDVVAASQAALLQYGCGAGASRLMAGTLPIHAQLEQRLARLKGYPAALVLGSGFLANLAAVTALVGRGDHIFMDRLCHASMVDAALLSRASIHRFRHNDVEHLRSLLASAPKGRRLMLTESVFSMDGDVAPLREIAAISSASEAMLVVDEAHATGVLGPGGAGLVREYALEQAVTVSMGTLSKALGGFGGFLACSEQIRDWMVNRARAFIFSTALPPAACGAALGALNALEQDTRMGDRLLERATAFRERLTAMGFNTGSSVTPIIPVIVGDNERALHLAATLKKRGIIAPAIRPPTVPAGAARLRLSVTLAHSEDDLAQAAQAIADAAAETCARDSGA